MKLSEELYNAFIAGDSVEMDFSEKAKKLEIEIDLLKDAVEEWKKLYEDLTWSNQR